MSFQAVSTRPRGDRPTPMALPDLARAAPEEFVADVRAETFVVLGKRGRTHLFSPAGKHVTSVRYNPASIARRRNPSLTGVSRTASPPVCFI